MLWHIGNTTVRTPYRLQEALRVLLVSPFNGNLHGREQEHAFARLLHESGVVAADRIEHGGDVSDLGRKWRSALSQLGFITPCLALPCLALPCLGLAWLGLAWLGLAQMLLLQRFNLL